MIDASFSRMCALASIYEEDRLRHHWKLMGLLGAFLALTVFGGFAPRGAENGTTAALAAGDNDGDGIPNTIENKAAYKQAGGSPNHKDIWVECDYMKGLKPNAKMKGYVETTFKNGPVTNPDGKKGVKIHLEIDDQLPFQKTWGDVQTQSGFTQVYNKTKQTRAAKLDGDKRYYHYCAFVNLISAENVGVSGISMDSTDPNGGIPGDMFVVALGGPWGDRGKTPETQAGTLIHELGHNIGLTHGGGGPFPTMHINYKPNYLSVMNYDFQEGFYSVQNGQIVQVAKWDYSTWKANDLNEKSLKEQQSVQAPPAVASKYIFVFRCQGQAVGGNFNQPVSWDCDNKTNETVQSDVNNDGRLDKLIGQDNWDNLIWDGGEIGGAGASAPSAPAERDELTYQYQLNLDADLLGATVGSRAGDESRRVSLDINGVLPASAPVSSSLFGGCSCGACVAARKASACPAGAA